VEIDMANADRVGQQLEAALAPGVTTVIADMTATRFCDSSGMSMLVRVHGRAAANGTELRLVVASAAVLRTLTLVGLGQLLPLYPSLSQALRGTLSVVGWGAGVLVRGACWLGWAGVGWCEDGQIAAAGGGAADTRACDRRWIRGGPGCRAGGQPSGV